MIGVAGAGAFGTALAVALAREGRAVTLWARDPAQAIAMRDSRMASRLPGVVLPENVTVTAEMVDLAGVAALLIAVPMQQLGSFLASHAGRLPDVPLVACCKGLDLATGLGPVALLARACRTPALLTGPSFAADIARGLPTALTLACADAALGEALQDRLSTATLRLYRTTDVIGAELGGAMKNVIAIAAGVVMGAGFGDSARAALLTRGNAEMTRLALLLGARAETLSGLSGLGDLVLTCTSDQSRNFRHGRALGSGGTIDPTATVEGVPTAQAVSALARHHETEMPISEMVAALTTHRITLPDAVRALLSRPLKEE
jgi:glycerol-3-phosphate dehydrogenase (NAD(P)+)